MVWFSIVLRYNEYNLGSKFNAGQGDAKESFVPASLPQVIISRALNVALLSNPYILKMFYEP